MTRKWQWFSKEEIDAWPPEHKACRNCMEVKPFSHFHKNDNGKQLFGIASDCKECRKKKSKLDWQKNKNNIRKNIFLRAKSRAKKKNIFFDLSEEDIVVPDVCPVFKKPFILGDPDWTYSLDRILPDLGYVEGNVLVVSIRANVIKNNASVEEIFTVGNFYKAILNDKEDLGGGRV